MLLSPKLKKYVGILVVLLFLGGISWYVYATYFKSTRTFDGTFQTTKVKARDITASTAVIGTVSPSQTANLSFGSNAKVTAIFAKNGTHVESGALIAEIDSSDTKIQLLKDEASLASAKAQLEKTKKGLPSLDKKVLEVSLENARTSYKNAKISAENDIKNAEIAVENAKKLYEASSSTTKINDTQTLQTLEDAVAKAQKDLTSTLQTNANTIKTAQNTVQTAELALSNATSSAGATTSVQDQNLSKAQEDAFYGANTQLTQVDTTLKKINEIITVEEYNKDLNLPYRAQLGVQNFNSYNDTVAAYYALKDTYTKNVSLFTLSNTSLSYEEIVKRLSTLKNMLTQSYSTLDTTYAMINNSLTSKDLSQASLDLMKQNIFNQRNTINQALASIASTQSTVATIQIQKTSSNTTSDNSIKSSENALENAKQNYETTKIQIATAEMNARNALKVAQDNLAKEKALLAGTNVSLLNSYTSYTNAQHSLETTKQKAESQIESALAALNSNEAQFAVQTAPADTASIQTQIAQMQQAEANMQTTKNILLRTKLIAPVSGIVSGLTLQPGDQVSNNATIASIISDNITIVDTQISETVVNKVQVGQPVKISFDALPNDEKIDGTVSYIDAQKTLTDNVVTYKTQITFTPKDSQKMHIRSGMTANLEIITSSIKDALSLPNQAIKKELVDDVTKYYVRVYDSANKTAKAPIKKDIVPGIKGNDFTQILEGLALGDTVILSGGTTATTPGNPNRNASSTPTTAPNQRNNAIRIPGL